MASELEDPEDVAFDVVDPEVAHEAIKAVTGDRGHSYGHPWQDFSKTAQMWKVLFPESDVTPQKVAMAMMMVKISRELNRPKRDNVVDIVGYAITLDAVNKHAEKLEANWERWCDRQTWSNPYQEPENWEELAKAAESKTAEFVDDHPIPYAPTGIDDLHQKNAYEFKTMISRAVEDI